MLILTMINLDHIVQCVCVHVCNRKSDLMTTYMEGNVKVRQGAYSVVWITFSLRNFKLNEQILLVIISFFYKDLYELIVQRSLQTENRCSSNKTTGVQHFGSKIILSFAVTFKTE